MTQVSCITCKRMFNKHPRDIRRFPNSFCSQPCYHYFQDNYMAIVQEPGFAEKLLNIIPEMETNDIRLTLGAGIREPALTSLRLELLKRELHNYEQK